MILIIGSTGHVGKELVPQLLQSGQQLRVLVRDEQKVAHLDPIIERAVGNLNNPASLTAAMRGVERVFLVTLTTQQDVNVLEAAKRTAVKHIVKLSTMEATEHKIAIGKWSFEREELIRALRSRLDFPASWHVHEQFHRLVGCKHQGTRRSLLPRRESQSCTG